MKKTISLLLTFCFLAFAKGENMKNQKVLVAYFSATGTTQGVAKNIAKAAGADIFEIIPKEPYTQEDLNWHDKQSRTTKECNDKNSRPQIASFCNNLKDYDTILLGFPIWWYYAPHIIQTFLESYDFSGKTIALFCTSGGSGLGNTQSVLEKSVSKNTKWKEGKRFSSNASQKEIQAWLGKVIE